MDSQINHTYRDLIKDELQLRMRRNKRYSLRAFARDLDVSVAYLSLIFNNRRHLSLSAAVKLAKKLNWDIPRQEYFLTLLEIENPKTEINRSFASSRMQKISSHILRHKVVDPDTFTLISVWYYGAICTLLTLNDFVATLPAICERLNLKKVEAQIALKRLKRLGFVKEEGGVWFPTHNNVEVKSVPSQAIRFYHKQVLALASTAIDEQSFEEREFSNVTVAVDPAQIALAKKKIFEFKSEMIELLGGSKSSELYQLSIQMFKLTKEGSK